MLLRSATFVATKGSIADGSIGAVTLSARAAPPSEIGRRLSPTNVMAPIDTTRREGAEVIINAVDKCLMESRRDMEFRSDLNDFGV